MARATKPKMLILSFSDISSDARVLKQLQEFKGEYDIITCGLGPKPKGARKHLRVPNDEASLRLDGRLITARQYRAAYWTLPAVRSMWGLVKPLRGHMDVVIANETETAPIASKLKPRCGTLVDLHEYTPSLQEHLPAWKRRIAPFWAWVIKTYVAKADAWTSPSGGVDRKYEEEFGFRPLTVTNAAPHHSLVPSPVGDPIRLVHHGSAQRNRNMERMIEAVQSSAANVTFDLFLTGTDPTYREELREMAARDTRTHVHNGIPYSELISKLNNYDVGVFFLPPVTYNYEWALPNKLFDFVQARLGQVVSPNPEMKQVIEDNGLGAVMGGYETQDLTRALEALTIGQVEKWKQAAQERAKALSSEPQVQVWAELVNTLMDDCRRG